MPRFPSRRFHYPRRETRRSPGLPDGVEQADGLTKALPLVPAVGAALEVPVQGRALLRREKIVRLRREELAGFATVHDQNRSKRSFSSIRARWRRDRTVFRGSSRAAAISS